MSCVLNVKNLEKTYPQKPPFHAVKGISFDLKAGEILGLLGPNGSGKTTTIQMLLGTLIPTVGSIHYFGRDFFKYRSELLHHISFASTYASLPFLLTVEENLKCFGLLYGIKDPLVKAEPLLKRFGIYDKCRAKVSTLSAGQTTRLMLVKAFFTDPKIVLLDEPTASLDPDAAHDVCRFLLEQRKEKGIAIIFTSHKMDEVAELCDRVIVLKNGLIIANDLPKTLAKSVSFYRLRLNLIEGMQRAVELAKQHQYAFHIEGRSFSCSLDEKEVPRFLYLLMQNGISYSNIQIQEPSLEEYFLHIAGVDQ